MKHKKLILSIIILVITFFVIQQKFYINPNAENSIRNKLKEQGEYFVVYKNSHRSHKLYLSTNFNKIDLPENTVIEKVKIDDSINVILPTNELYENAKVGDKIYKLENSNRCFIKRNDSIILFNYLNTNIEGFEEWNPAEINKIIIKK